MKSLFKQGLVYPTDQYGRYVECEGSVTSVDALTGGDLIAVDAQTQYGSVHAFWTCPPIATSMGIATSPEIGDLARLRIYDWGGGWYPDNQVTGWERRS